MSFPSVAAAAAALSLASLARAQMPDFTGEPVVGGYWPVYGGWPNVDQIPYDLMTHIDYFVGSTTENFTTDISGGMPLATAKEDIAALIGNATAAGVSVSLTVGGYYGSVYFSDLVANPDNRTAYANEIADTLSTYGFNGLDIDWEFPNAANSGTNSGTGKPYSNIYAAEDADNFITFLQVLRGVIGNTTDARLSATINAAGFNGADGNPLSDYSGFANQLDYITIMMYDTYGTWSATTGPNAPLDARCDDVNYSVMQSIDYYIAGGFDPSHIILALAGYGHEFRTNSSTLETKTINGTETMIFQAQTGEVTNHTSIPYNFMVNNDYISSDGSTAGAGYTRYWDDCTQTPFLFNPDTKSFISYDDVESLTLKIQYAQDKGLAGVTLFDMSDDTTDFVLLNTISSVMGSGSKSEGTMRKAGDKPALHIPQKPAHVLGHNCQKGIDC